jgi:hypothetical protein
MLHSLFKLLLCRLKLLPLVSVRFLTVILLIAPLRKGTLRIELVLYLIVILLTQVIQYMLLFLYLILDTPLERF